MPARPLRGCLEFGCRELVAGHGRCPAHAKARDRIEWREHGSSHERGYGQQWRGRRLAVLQDAKGLCERCAESGRLAVARVVDHKKAKALGGTDDRENLWALCEACNIIKTNEDLRRIAERKRAS